MEKGHKIEILDKGHVIYLHSLGSDQTIVDSARVSYQSPSKGPEADRKLLEYLYKNKHMSPFEQVNISFIIKMPIFCMRQFVRHRTFRLNEMSARYTEMWDDMYLPDKWRKQDTKNKQGSLETDELNQNLISDRVARIYRICYEEYQWLISQGVAKEMARFVLPVANYTEIQVNIDIRNLMHFFGLRLDAHAQWEMREIAKAMYEIFKEVYPWCAGAFEKYQIVVAEVGQNPTEAK